MSITVLKPGLAPSGRSRAGERLAAGLAALTPISLDELNATSALMTRVDRKYLARPAQIAELIADLPADSRVLTIDGRTEFNYRSTYFDSPDLDFYLQAARRRPRRIKVRTRHYVDSDQMFLEVKSRSTSWTHKERVEAVALDRIDALGQQLIDSTHEELNLTEVPTDDLAPVLVCEYQRTTVAVGADSSRVTFDTDLVWSDESSAATLDDWVVVETKGGIRPGLVDRLLWRAGVRPSRTSKYCTGLAALHPELPHNRWHRTLQRLAS